MALKDELLATGMTEEQAVASVKLVETNYKGYVPQYRLDDKEKEITTLRDQVKQRDGQITDLSKFEGTNEDLQKQVATLTADNKAKDETHAKELESIEVASLALHELSSIDPTQGQPQNAKFVLGLLNMEAIKVVTKDGVKTLDGFTDQVETLRKEQPYVFKDATVPNEGGSKNGLDNLGFKVVGKPPVDGDGGKGGNTSEDFGKRMAATKAKQQGINQGE